MGPAVHNDVQRLRRDRYQGFPRAPGQGLCAARQEDHLLVRYLRDRPGRRGDRVQGQDLPVYLRQVPPDRGLSSPALFRRAGGGARFPGDMDHHSLDPAGQYGRGRGRAGNLRRSDGPRLRGELHSRRQAGRSFPVRVRAGRFKGRAYPGRGTGRAQVLALPDAPSAGKRARAQAGDLHRFRGHVHRHRHSPYSSWTRRRGLPRGQEVGLGRLLSGQRGRPLHRGGGGFRGDEDLRGERQGAGNSEGGRPAARSLGNSSQLSALLALQAAGHFPRHGTVVPESGYGRAQGRPDKGGGRRSLGAGSRS